MNKPCNKLVESATINVGDIGQYIQSYIEAYTDEQFINVVNAVNLIYFDEMDELRANEPIDPEIEYSERTKEMIEYTLRPPIKDSLREFVHKLLYNISENKFEFESLSETEKDYYTWFVNSVGNYFLSGKNPPNIYEYFLSKSDLTEENGDTSIYAPIITLTHMDSDVIKMNRNKK